jgi:Ca2+-binding RTX toxin-like protein
MRTRFTGVLIGVAVFALSIAAVAAANTIAGTSGDDVITGTPRADSIKTFGGNDIVRARRGNDKVNVGVGNDISRGNGGADRLRGNNGNDNQGGGSGEDLVRGGLGDDVQTGGRGSDVVFSGPGADVSSGGPGNDDVWGLVAIDVTNDGSTTVDRLFGNGGNDTIHARDGEADQISCGAGNDVALLDNVDVVDGLTPPANPGAKTHSEGSCEKVQRKDPKPQDQAEEPTT